MKPVTCNPWCILIVDDDDIIHEVTESVLSDIVVHDVPVVFHHAYSAAETLGKIKEAHYCVVLLDIVMEKATSGLDIVAQIREQDSTTRIIVRTGDSQRSEKDISKEYEIHGYMEKSSKASQLTSIVMAAIRSHAELIHYQTIETDLVDKLEDHKRSLEDILSRFSKHRTRTKTVDI